MGMEGQRVSERALGRLHAELTWGSISQPRDRELSRNPELVTYPTMPPSAPFVDLFKLMISTMQAGFGWVLKALRVWF